ncbi:MAG TPA: S-methyl-5'-thioinosine phosphorylase [Gammaproteobacteria bacterium]|jgi:5'-methylthioinosine phosphorylase
MLAIIGGSGLYGLDEQFVAERQAARETPYGATSADIVQGCWQDLPVAFLPRHGPDHDVPPHRINYRANIWALREIGASHIIAVNAVGGIAAELAPRALAVPDQIIDYTSGREHTFCDGGDQQVRHVDFTWPYDAQLRSSLLEAGRQLGVPLVGSGTYGCSNGPRLETAAEIARMRNDGCAMVGMTGMPEAALARELEIAYAGLALVVNWAAGIEQREITMEEIYGNLEQGMQQVKPLLRATAARVAQ